MATDVTYVVGHKASTDHLLHTFGKLFPVLLRCTKRSGVKGVAKVLVQGFHDGVEVVLVESSTPFVNEFGLGGFEFHDFNHLREAGGGGILWRWTSQPPLDRRLYISRPRARSPYSVEYGLGWRPYGLGQANLIRRDT